LRVTEWLARNPVPAASVEEIRLRAGYPVCVVYLGTDALLEEDGAGDGRPGAAVARAEVEKTLSLVSDCSYYALESEFANGYVTIPGGHRVGLSGQVAVWPDGTIRIREVSGLNFRVARAVRGAGERLAPLLANRNGRLCSTLIVSPPGCGKTTLLRDLCRISSEGLVSAGIRPCQVGVVDERSEIAACYLGVPQHDLGPRVDVLDRCPKARGIIMLLRSMGPGVIATDEIGGEEDARAVATALSGGASVLATCHGEDVDQVRRRPYSSWMLSSGYFDRVVVLSRRKGPGTVEYVGGPG
jgi:stage III sporulation protein AA